MADSPQENPVLTKWKEVAGELQVARRRAEAAIERRDELERKEQMLRGALVEAGVEILNPEQILATYRRVSGDRMEDMILGLVAAGETVTAAEILNRAEAQGVALPSKKNPKAAIRSAMRRSSSFVLVRRGMFRRQMEREGSGSSSEEAPPPQGGNGASALF